MLFGHKSAMPGAVVPAVRAVAAARGTLTTTPTERTGLLSLGQGRANGRQGPCWRARVRGRCCKCRAKTRASMCAPHRRRAGAARVARHHCALRLLIRPLTDRPFSMIGEINSSQVVLTNKLTSVAEV